jgi:ligand-binding sensor domain-containing protein/tRNA A-37 threonylcarbamoyl transferase component Bud32
MMFIKWRRFFLSALGALAGVCMLTAGSLLFALDPSMSILQYNLEAYTTEDGLPQSSVLSIVQTSDGYLWMGTYEGFARFDGMDFKIFDTSNTPEMASNRVKVLMEDSGKRLWIGTSGGLLCYEDGGFKNYTTAHGLSSDFIVTLYEDRRGTLWIGTTHGLNRFENGVFKAYTEKHGLSRDYVAALVEDEDGNLWIGTSGGGLHFLRPGNDRISRCPMKGLPADVDVRTLFKDREGRIWVGTGGRGLAVTGDEMDGKCRLYTQKDGLSGSDVRAIFQDSHGTLWIGTNGQGLNTFKDGVFSYSDSEQGFLNSPIRAVLEDREGSLWIGTRDGLSQLKEGKFIIYNKRNGLPVDSVRTVFQDNAGNIWLGTVNGGLVRFNDGQFKIFGTGQGLKSLHIWTIAQGGDRSIWFGTYGGGLHRLKDGRVIKVFNTRNGLANNVVRAIFVDREGYVWVGTNGGGVDVINPADGSAVNYNSRNGLADDFVYSIAGDTDGNVWVGTYDGSLTRFTGGVPRVFGENDGLTGHAIWTVYVDRIDKRTVWLGTDGAGLVRFKDNVFTRFTTRNGLYSDLAFAAFEDLRGNFWMNCNKGIYSVRKDDLEGFAAGEIQRIPVTSFRRTEGIKNTESNGPAQPAGICTTDGKIWFPTIRGAVVIDQENVKINRAILPVILEEIRADGQLIYSYPSRQVNPLVLPAGKKRLEFKYTGLSFVAPERVRFKYKLEGFDEDFFDAGPHRIVSYTNIEPGDYTLKIIGCNNDGIWNEQGVSFAFTVEAFFWQTWWFKSLVVFVFAVLSYLVIGFIRRHIRLIAFWKKSRYIGPYEIEDQIGVGGMGIIYRVHSLLDRSRVYALKVMKEEHLVDEVQKRRFKNESLMVDQIDHPNIVKVHERGEDNGNLYIVMELLEGQTLAQRFKDDRYPNVDQCVHIMYQVASILVNLHREDIIHRDLKPENIMLVNREGDPDFVKLLDFGLARVQSFSHLTETGHVLGTIPYMPPEIVSDGSPSKAVDIYSLGIIGYEMLTKQKPFSGEKPVETMRKIVNITPPDPIELNPNVPTQLNDLIVHMINKKAQNRPDAQEVLAALINASGGQKPF